VEEEDNHLLQVLQVVVVLVLLENKVANLGQEPRAKETQEVMHVVVVGVLQQVEVVREDPVKELGVMVVLVLAEQVEVDYHAS
jgi:hypothetical protein